MEPGLHTLTQPAQVFGAVGGGSGSVTLRQLPKFIPSCSKQKPNRLRSTDDVSHQAPCLFLSRV